MAILRQKRTFTDYFELIDKTTGLPLNNSEYEIRFKSTDSIGDAGDPYNEAWTQELLDTFFAQLTEFNTLNDGDEPYTLVIGDAGLELKCENTSALNITIPPNASIPFPVGTTIIIFRDGAGAVNLVAGGGVTINSRDSLLSIGNQYSGVTIEKTGTDTWRLFGDLA